MTLTAKRCGWLGAAVVFGLTLLVGILAKIPPFDSALRQASGAILDAWVYPVIQTWEWLLPKIGFAGERAMLMLFPMIFSCLFYAGLVGFGIGWFSFKIFGRTK